MKLFSIKLWEVLEEEGTCCSGPIIQYSVYVPIHYSIDIRVKKRIGNMQQVWLCGDIQGHSYNCFPWGLKYIILYILVSLTRVCVVYIFKEVASFRGVSQFMGMACKKCALELSDQKEDIGRM